VVNPPEWLGPGFTVRIEKEEAPEDAMQRRRKDWWLFLATLLGSAILFTVALVGAFGPWTTVPQQSLAGNLLGALAAGFFGYLFGKRSAE
jgi:uncharacterized membrane protein YdcZ (DUF606 family)